MIDKMLCCDDDDEVVEVDMVIVIEKGGGEAMNNEQRQIFVLVLGSWSKPGFKRVVSRAPAVALIARSKTDEGQSDDFCALMNDTPSVLFCLS
jgi:hypothetical protein